MPIKLPFNLLDVYDTDLPAGNRTEANFWKAECLVYLKEINKANKGLRRLSKQNKRFRDVIHNMKEDYDNK